MQRNKCNKEFPEIVTLIVTPSPAPLKKIALEKNGTCMT